MTQEEKQLLLKDLCARLPYGVQVQVDGHINPLQILGISKLHKSTWAWKKGTYVVSFWNDTKAIENIKPYLRPMSSMTEEEAKEVCRLENYENRIICVIPNHTYHFTVGDSVIDWLNEHHFDFRNLIEKGLAIDCTNLNIY